MTEKNLFVAVIIILVVGAAIFGGVSRFKSDLESVPTPGATASPSDILSGDTLSQQSKVAPSPTESPKTMKQYQSLKLLNPEQIINKKAVLETSKGKIEFEIYPEATKAASNFIFLAQDKYYDGLTFHRVVSGFVIQGGDPTGTGAGGPGYQFEDEPVTKKYNKGIVAMANSGPNTNGSQFFIMLEDNLTLPPQYTIFGKVISGQAVVDKIAVGDIMQKVMIESLK